jgi:hypothetical protein
MTFVILLGVEMRRAVCCLIEGCSGIFKAHTQYTIQGETELKVEALDIYKSTNRGS